MHVFLSDLCSKFIYRLVNGHTVLAENQCYRHTVSLSRGHTNKRKKEKITFIPDIHG